jgi:hypothetical protein
MVVGSGVPEISVYVYVTITFPPTLLLYDALPVPLPPTVVDRFVALSK